MIELPSLYPHQEDQKNRTRIALARHGRVILSANPGVGKTRMSKWILGASFNREPGPAASGKSLFAVHRRGLVDNACNSFLESPELPHGVIMAGEETHFGRSIQVASIDSLLSWFCENDAYQQDMTFDLIVFDEAHSHHQKLARFLRYHDAKREELGLHRAFVIGLTATPQAQGLADVYKEIVLGPPTQWLIDNKFLAPFRYFSVSQGRKDLLVKRGNEFTKDSEAAAMDGLSGAMVRDWMKHAYGRPTVGFFPRRSHAKEAAKEFQRTGLRVEYVDGETPDEERRSIFRALNEHWIDYVCNVAVVERGTDIPRIGCVQLCVAIGTVVRYRQMIGRGSRCHPAKTDCIVLDHLDNVRRLGFFEDDPPWSLDVTTKDPGEAGTRPTIECPNCSAIYRGGRCSSCGYEPTPEELRGQRLEFDGRELKEIVREEKTTTTKTPEDMMRIALYKAGKSGRTWKQCVGIYYGMNKSQATNHRVPKFVTIGERRYRMIASDSPDASRRVEHLYPFTVERGNHGGKYLVAETPEGISY